MVSDNLLLNRLKWLQLRYWNKPIVSEAQKTREIMEACDIRDELVKRGYYIIGDVIKGSHTFHIIGMVKHEDIVSGVPDDATCGNCYIKCSEGSLTGGRVLGNDGEFKFRCCTSWIRGEKMYRVQE